MYDTYCVQFAHNSQGWGYEIDCSRKEEAFLTQGTTMSALSHVPQPIFELLGVAGFVFYMASYALLQLGKIAGHSYSYTLMNLIAASLVLSSLIHQFNLASVLIQVAWIVISVFGLCRIGVLKYRETQQRDQPVAELV